LAGTRIAVHHSELGAISVAAYILADELPLGSGFAAVSVAYRVNHLKFARWHRGWWWPCLGFGTYRASGQGKHRKTPGGASRAAQQPGA
jgi:hypothetical protein